MKNRRPEIRNQQVFGSSPIAGSRKAGHLKVLGFFLFAPNRSAVASFVTPSVRLFDAAREGVPGASSVGSISIGDDPSHDSTDDHGELAVGLLVVGGARVDLETEVSLRGQSLDDEIHRAEWTSPCLQA